MMRDSELETGNRYKVEPIRNLKDIEKMKEVVAGNPRNYAILTIGINTSLRAGELVSIGTGQVRHLEEGGAVEVKEEGARTGREVSFNADCVAAIRTLVDTENLKDDDKLFQSQRGGPLSVTSLDKLVKKWCEAINLQGNYGGDSLRKTWEYHQPGYGEPENP